MRVRRLPTLSFSLNDVKPHDSISAAKHLPQLHRYGLVQLVCFFWRETGLQTGVAMDLLKPGHFAAAAEQGSISLAGKRCTSGSQRRRRRVDQLARCIPEFEFGASVANRSRKAVRAGVPIHQHTAKFQSHGGSHAAHQLLVGIKAAAPRYSDFWG